MKKILLISIISFVCGHIHAANIMFYDKDGSFWVVPSKQVGSVGYNEKEKELGVIRIGQEYLVFKVETKEEALNIIKKIFDDDDNSLIVLKQK